MIPLFIGLSAAIITPMISTLPKGARLTALTAYAAAVTLACALLLRLRGHRQVSILLFVLGAAFLALLAFSGWQAWQR